MGSFSHWFDNEILGVFEGNTPVIPSTLYVACHSTACSEAIPGTELSGDGYARFPITFERVSDIQRWNPTAVSSSTASAEWSVASLSIWDDANIGGGNYYAFGNLTATLTVEANKAIQCPEHTVNVGMGT